MTTLSAAPNAVTVPSSAPRLRLALNLDAAVTGLNGVAYLAAASILDGLLGLPSGALRPVGAFLLVFSALVWLVGARPRISGRAVGAVIGVNVLWAVESIVVAIAGWGSPTTLGTVWILMQAAVVAGFAALQGVALRRR